VAPTASGGIAGFGLVGGLISVFVPNEDLDAVITILSPLF
jgi:hypothetical protein